MKNKSLMVLIIIAIILGLGIGYIYNKRNLNQKITEETGVVTDENRQAEAPPQAVEEGPSPTLVPPPTFAPMTERITKIDSINITIAGKNGEMLIPKDPNFVKVMKKSGGSLVPASFEEAKVGQQVTLKIIIPGKEAELILE